MIVKTDEKNYQDIADAIRERNGSDTLYKPNEMAEAIEKLDFVTLYIERLSKGLDKAIADGYLTDSQKQEVIDFFIERGGGDNPNTWNADYIVDKSGAKVQGKYGVAVLFDYTDYLGEPNINADIVIRLNIHFSNAYELNTPAYVIIMQPNSRIYSYSMPLFAGNSKVEKIIGTAYLYDKQIMNSGFINFSSVPDISFCQFKESDKIMTMGNFAFCNKKIKHIKINAVINGSFSSAFGGCVNLENVELVNAKCTNAFRAFYSCYKIEIIKGINFIDNYDTTGLFWKCNNLMVVEITNWVRNNVSFSDSPNLSPFSINYLIENCDKDGGTLVARTLTLHADAKANWQNSPDYEKYQAMATEKLITIA